MDDAIFKRYYERQNYTIFSALIKVQENIMITSDEEVEYGIFELLSDVGGGLGIFLGLSLLRYLCIRRGCIAKACVLLYTLYSS